MTSVIIDSMNNEESHVDTQQARPRVSHTVLYACLFIIVVGILTLIFYTKPQWMWGAPAVTVPGVVETAVTTQANQGTFMIKNTQTGADEKIGITKDTIITRATNGTLWPAATVSGPMVTQNAQYIESGVEVRIEGTPTSTIFNAQKIELLGMYGKPHGITVQ